MSELQDKIRELQELRDQQSKLLDELARSVALKEFIPDAFDYGACKSYVIGNEFQPRDMRFVVELNNGESREFPVTEVPGTLLPDAVRRALNK